MKDIEVREDLRPENAIPILKRISARLNGTPEWDGCDKIIITDFCPGCKHAEYCKEVAGGS
jgi:hypothetical protein